MAGRPGYVAQVQVAGRDFLGKSAEGLVFSFASVAAPELRRALAEAVKVAVADNPG